MYSNNPWIKRLYIWSSVYFYSTSRPLAHVPVATSSLVEVRLGMLGTPKHQGGVVVRQKRAAPGDGVYRYVVLPGNNSRLLLSIFRDRPWWQPHKATSAESPDLIWEMYRNPKRYSPQVAKGAGAGGKGQVEADTVFLNHFEKDRVLVTKHGLYWSLKAHCGATGFATEAHGLPSWVPETYHVVPASVSSASVPAPVPASALGRAKYDDGGGDDGDSGGEDGEGGDLEEAAESSKALEWGRFVSSFDAHAKRSVGAAPDLENESSAAGSAGSSVAGSRQPSREGSACGSSVSGAEQVGLLPPISLRPEEQSVALSAASKLKKGSRRRRSKGRGMVNMWIAKPAALSNRGSGIEVVTSVAEVAALLDASAQRRGRPRKAGYVVQKYIERPLLVGGRKFDIRVFLLVSVDRRSGRLRGHLHRDGYVRTSSYAYSTSEDSLRNPAVHLTNDGKSEGERRRPLSPWCERVDKRGVPESVGQTSEN